jgi:hypothetical protein
VFDTTRIRLEDDSIIVTAGVVDQSGALQDCDFILDTGDAIGPVFNAADAERLGLAQGDALEVSGAGGKSSVFATTASVQFDRKLYENETGAIDTDLEGPSLLGLPFFLRETKVLTLDFVSGKLTVD